MNDGVIKYNLISQSELKTVGEVEIIDKELHLTTKSGYTEALYTLAGHIKVKGRFLDLNVSKDKNIIRIHPVNKKYIYALKEECQLVLNIIWL